MVKTWWSPSSVVLVSLGADEESDYDGYETEGCEDDLRGGLVNVGDNGCDRGQRSRQDVTHAVAGR